MGQSSIPVDLFNPGQVFACLGFMEAAEVICGDAEGGFDWTNEVEARFELRAAGTTSPVDAVLDFLINARRERFAPKGYADPPSKGQGKKEGRKQTAGDRADDATGDDELRLIETFPAPEADHLALPVRFERNPHVLDVSHWCDASSRDSFKLFAGQQRSSAIAQQMVAGMKKLWKERRWELTGDPLGLTAPLGGSSFKFDARKAWTPIDAGYSPDKQAYGVEASPVVEMLAAIGLEHARPDEFETRDVRYGVWNGLLPPVLARPALGGARVGIPIRIFRFTLDLAGKNKVVTFAREETRP
jgi:CRISPR-associated protein Csx14